MTNLVPTLAIAFVAVCVWLLVRIINRRERWAKWTLAVIAGLPVLYVASFGPACWWLSEPVQLSDNFVLAPEVYLPIGWLAFDGDSPTLEGLLRRYAEAGSKKTVLVPFRLKDWSNWQYR